MPLCLAIRLDIRLDVPSLPPDTPGAPGKKKINTCVRHTPAYAGNTCHAHNHRPFPGLTPAGAGNTHSGHRKAMLTRTHPRLHEEYGVGGAIVLAAIDSPPLTRGIRLARDYRSRIGGLTPVCTGNAATSSTYRQPEPTHPRLHGEYTSYPGLILARATF